MDFEAQPIISKENTFNVNNVTLSLKANVTTLKSSPNIGTTKSMGKF